MGTHPLERLDFWLVFLVGRGKPSLPLGVVIGLRLSWSFSDWSDSSVSSLKRSRWARPLQSALHLPPGPPHTLSPAPGSAAGLWGLWDSGPCPVGWRGDWSPSPILWLIPLVSGSGGGWKLTGGAGLPCSSLSTEGSKASNTWSISSSRASDDSPTANDCPTAYIQFHNKPFNVQLQKVKRATDYQHVPNSPCRVFCVWLHVIDLVFPVGVWIVLVSVAPQVPQYFTQRRRLHRNVYNDHERQIVNYITVTVNFNRHALYIMNCAVNVSNANYLFFLMTWCCPI